MFMERPYGSYVSTKALLRRIAGLIAGKKSAARVEDAVKTAA
jgi:hypothetical protein